jgi:hypothetical protein
MNADSINRKSEGLINAPIVEDPEWAALQGAQTEEPVPASQPVAVTSQQPKTVVREPMLPDSPLVRAATAFARASSEYERAKATLKQAQADEQSTLDCKNKALVELKVLTSEVTE